MFDFGTPHVGRGKVDTGKRHDVKRAKVQIGAELLCKGTRQMESQGETGNRIVSCGAFSGGGWQPQVAGGGKGLAWRGEYLWFNGFQKRQDYGHVCRPH